MIVFRPGVDPLPLLAESLALLPAGCRWNVSFSTYFSKLPPGLGVPVALRAGRESGGDCQPAIAGALVIDLTKPRARRRAALVEAARTGVVPRTPAAVSQPEAGCRAYRASD